MVDTSNLDTVPEIAIQKSSKWACLRKRMGYPKSTGLSSFSAVKQSFWGLYTPFPDTPNYHSHCFYRGFSEGLPQQPQSMVIIIFEARSALCSNVPNAEPNLRISCWVVHSGPMFRHHVTYFPYLFMVSLMSLVGHPLQLVRFFSSPEDSTPQRGSASPCPRCRTMTVPALQRLQRRKRGSWCSLETCRAGFTYPSRCQKASATTFSMFNQTTYTKDHPKTCLGSLPCKPPRPRNWWTHADHMAMVQSYRPQTDGLQYAQQDKCTHVKLAPHVYHA